VIHDIAISRVMLFKVSFLQKILISQNPQIYPEQKEMIVVEITLESLQKEITIL